jgi:hypothetical protein
MATSPGNLYDSWHSLTSLFCLGACKKGLGARECFFVSAPVYTDVSVPAKPQTEAGAETVLRAPKQKKGGVCLFLKIRRIFKNEQNRGGNVLR